MKTDKEIKIVYGIDYPLQDPTPGHHSHYVRHPIQKDGKWWSVEVIQDGYIPIGPAHNPFDTEKECQKACDGHNRFHKFNKKFVNEIIGRSMGFMKWDVPEKFFITQPLPSSRFYHVFNEKDNRSLCGKYAMFKVNKDQIEPYKGNETPMKNQDCASCFNKAQKLTPKE